MNYSSLKQLAIPESTEGSPLYITQRPEPVSSQLSSVFESLPIRSDPRWPVLALLTLYVILGITVLDFNRTLPQILTTVASACLLDVCLHFVLRRRTLLFPLSAAISAMGLGILANYAHGVWPLFIPVFFSIASKYVFTFQGRHVYNPTMFGIVASLLWGQGMISIAPAYQWGGTTSVALFIVTCALLLFVFKIGRSALIVSFLSFYFIQTGIRAWLTRYHVPPETLFFGSLSSPAFYLFAFFMITDPVTSPKSSRQQVAMSFGVVLLDFILHKLQTLSTLFFAGIIYATGRFIFLHVREIIRKHGRYQRELFHGLVNISACGFLAVSGLSIYRHIIHPITAVTPGWDFTEMTPEHTGILARPSDLLSHVDPKIANMGKWLLSVGDAVAIADVNADFLPDIFFTLPLKDPRDRVALYLNKGNFQFERVGIPALNDLAQKPEEVGLASGALWFDYDNDGDPDLFLTVGWGRSRLFKNLFLETGRVAFEDVTEVMHLTDFTISVAANALDMNADGKLDLVIGNAMGRFLPGYDSPTVFNIFHLPDPAYPGDRRMLNVMHRTWYDANNGGEKFVFLNNGDRFENLSETQTGISGRRWTLAIGAGDLNGDGLPDLYFANDFGPDELYINLGGNRFRKVMGTMVGDIGRDTYKGMNASLGDIDNNGFADIYVSNVHERLQAEGSMLWLNSGDVLARGAASFVDEALPRNALNERRFGWGAALGDFDRDGKLDIAQANGHIDDAYDKRYEKCQNFWYWNAQIALTAPETHGYTDAWADIRGRCVFPSEFNRVYLNQGNVFVDIAHKVGWTNPGTSRAVALADLDNDGTLDAVVTHMYAPPSIYRNVAQPRSWVGLKLEGDGKTCNRDAVGTKVVIQSPPGSALETQMREVYAANGLSAQGDQRLLIGLGNSFGDVDIDVFWCGRKSSDSFSLAMNSYHYVVQGKLRSN